MLRIRDHKTLDLFDRWAYLGPKRRRLLERSWTGVFRQYLLSEFPVEELVSRAENSLIIRVVYDLMHSWLEEMYLSSTQRTAPL